MREFKDSSPWPDEEAEFNALTHEQDRERYYAAMQMQQAKMAQQQMAQMQMQAALLPYSWNPAALVNAAPQRAKTQDEIDLEEATAEVEAFLKEAREGLSEDMPLHTSVDKP